MVESKGWDFRSWNVENMTVLLDGFHPGCEERRDYKKKVFEKLWSRTHSRVICDFDGRFSIAPVNATHFRLFARANPIEAGGRHVSTAMCTLRGCAAMRLIEINGYAHGQRHADNNIYFLCVQWDQRSGSFLGVAPVVHEGRAYIGLTWSWDGESWAAFEQIFASLRDASDHRAVDQPACGMRRRGEELHVLVQRNVPGIWAHNHSCCRPMPASSLTILRVRDTWGARGAALNRSADRFRPIPLPPARF